MVFGSRARIEALENHISTLLIVTAILNITAVINTGIIFINEGYDFQTVNGPLLLIGLFASVVALIGICSRSRESPPTFAEATGTVASLALLAVIVLFLRVIGGRIGPLPDTPAPLAIVSLILVISSFALAGVTVIRSSVYTRLIGILLVAEAVALLLVIVVPVVMYRGNAPAEATIGIELVHAVMLLLAGLLIRGATEPGRQEPAVGESYV